MGPAIGEFEQAFAAYCGSQHCIGVSSGTSALVLVLRAYGVGAGDEVITAGAHVHCHGRGDQRRRRHAGLCGHRRRHVHH